MSRVRLKIAVAGAAANEAMRSGAKTHDPRAVFRLHNLKNHFADIKL